MFAGFDADASGYIECDELQLALKRLGLDEKDAKQALASFDTDGDQRISLSEWEAGLDSTMRAAIEAKTNAEGSLSSSS